MWGDGSESVVDLAPVLAKGGVFAFLREPAAFDAVAVGPRGRTLVWGHVLNDGDLPARSVRLLVEGIGPGGELLGQEIAWVGSLTPGMRAYFEVPVKTPAPAYRVSVFAFDWVLSDDFHGRRHPLW